mgnify:CR=1 FL=1
MLTQFANTISIDDATRTNNKLKKASKIIGDYIHPDYYLASIIKRGSVSFWQYATIDT